MLLRAKTRNSSGVTFCPSLTTTKAWGASPHCSSGIPTTDLLNGRVTQENALNLDRGDVLSATDDHVLEAVANFDIAIGMDNRRIAAMKPPSLKGTCGSFLIVVIALHHDIAACYNFADSLSVVRNLIALCIDDQQFTGSDQFHSLVGFEGCKCLRGERGMFWSWLANADERRCLCQAIHLRDLPSQFAFDPLDGRRRWRGPRCQHAYLPLSRLVGFRRKPDVLHILGSISDTNQHGGSGTEQRHPFIADQREDSTGFYLAQAHVRRPSSGDRPDKGPAVGMEHR